jgi:quinol-cytochrome oxidoreductase complex cytochrome b subunit
MNLLTNFKKPKWLFIIGMIIILLTVILKIMGIVLMLQVPLFAIGLMIELFALIIFIKKKIAE